METKVELQEMIIAAMKMKQQVELSCFRALKTAIEVMEKSGITVGKTEIINILRKQNTQRKDSASSFALANRQELVDKENQEIAILQKLLPKELSPDEVEKIVSDSIAEVGATDKKQMGAVIKLALLKADGRIDNKTISTIVAKKLNQ
jgi:uncharacterized protein YqeY